MRLIDAALSAPLIAVDPDDPTVLHAATMEALVSGWPDGPLAAPCGAGGLKLLGGHPWPPRQLSLPADYDRCRDCWVATGRMRPRSEFKATV